MMLHSLFIPSLFQELITLWSLAAFSFFIQTAYGIQLLYNSSVPTTLSNACSEALLSNVACDPVVKNLRPNFFYTPETLARICTSDCKSALSDYQSLVQGACGEEILPGSFDLNVSALMIPGTYQYLFESTCLQDDGRYCNNVAAIAAAFEDPGNSMFNYLDTIPSDTTQPSECDACFVKSLKLEAGSPYFDGPVIASLSLYESMTSSCSVTGQPLTTTTLGFYTQEPTVTPTPCAGTTYAIQPADDCYSISTAQGIGTAWLLSDNDLPAWCAEFPTSGDLCLTNTCNVVTVQGDDTCKSIAKAANITEAQLHAWNPIINYGCYNLEKMNGTQLCVSAPGMNFVPPPTTDLAPITPTSAAPVPTDAAPDTKTCGRWYDVQPGDYCNLLTLKFGISLDDFIFLNPTINTNCTNLLADVSYCVQAVGDINTYSGRPGYTTATPTAPFTGIPFTALPDATETQIPRLYTPLPLANDTRDDCAAYFAGDDYQHDLTSTRWASNCAFAAYIYDVTLEDLGVWNPSLGDNLTAASACAFVPGLRYCGSYYPEADNTPTSTAAEATTTGGAPVAPGPTHTGQPATCDAWHVVEAGDSCQSVADAAGISLAQFLAWNPAVSSDCLDNFWLDQAYCVGVAGDAPAVTTTSSVPPTATSSGAVPSATGKPPAEWLQEGIVANCNKWDRAVSGDYCFAFAERNGITLGQLVEWNTALGTNGDNCGTAFWLDYYYCIGVSG